MRPHHRAAQAHRPRQLGAELATDALIVRLAAGVEGDLTLIADFKLSDLKRR
jgi:hypothetical protein